MANSFATALWAPDVLFELLNAGVDGVNWHIRPSTLNAPFNLKPGKLVRYRSSMAWRCSRR